MNPTGCSQPITLQVNGQSCLVNVDPFRRLVDVLREDLRLTGTKIGCGQGECGTCTVLLDGQPVDSCLLAAWQAEGHDITTIEGLDGPQAKALQQAFVQVGAVQCGFCSPGMLLSAAALLSRMPQPDEDAIRQALAGNLCRCTGYAKIVAAVKQAAARGSGEPA